MDYKLNLPISTLKSAFLSPREDHPGRRGSVRPKSSCKDTPRFRAKRHAARENLKRLSKAHN